ncbi:hypothetical protein GOP47_0027041 [Adiantum capillus-veneris]|nr:hypothetical protein GOP47_0027041 [Adiantum capillus-veneris]
MLTSQQCVKFQIRFGISLRPCFLCLPSNSVSNPSQHLSTFILKVKLQESFRKGLQSVWFIVSKKGGTLFVAQPFIHLIAWYPGGKFPKLGSPLQQRSTTSVLMVLMERQGQRHSFERISIN